MISSFVALTVATVSAHGGNINLVHACVRNNVLFNGANVRIVTANTNCAANETALDWPANIQGTIGNVQTVSDSVSTDPVGDQLILTTTCPSGFIALSGGARLSDENGDTRDGGGLLVHSFPVGNPATGWHASATNRQTSGDGIPATTLTVYATCAKVN